MEIVRYDNTIIMLLLKKLSVLQQWNENLQKKSTHFYQLHVQYEGYIYFNNWFVSLYSEWLQQTFRSLLLMTLHLPISPLKKRIPNSRRNDGGWAAACRNFQHVCVCQAVLICMALLARHACLNGQKTKKTKTNGHSYCTAWLPGAFRASVAVETQHQLSLEGDNIPHIGGESLFAPWQRGR